MSSFRRRSSRRYVARPKRNAERVIRADKSLISQNTQQVAYTFTATEACVVKSIKLDTGILGGASPNIPYVLVLVQEGYNANLINYPAATNDLYNPTMNVLISGVLTDSITEDNKSNWIGRKMKAGDRLALIYFNAATADMTVAYEINFSVLT